MRGADIFAKGVLAASSHITEGTEVIILINLGDTKVKRGLDFGQYKGRCLRLGRGTSCLGRSEIFRKEKGQWIVYGIKGLAIVTLINFLFTCTH